FAAPRPGVIPHCEVSSFAAEVIPVLFVTIASDAESQALADLTRHAAGRVAARAWMVLWSSEGVPVGEIAARLRRRPKTVRKWLRRFARSGAAGLADLPRSGRPPAAPALAPQVVRTQLSQPPSCFGYVCAIWSVASLCQHLGARCSLRLSRW